MKKVTFILSIFLLFFAFSDIGLCQNQVDSSLAPSFTLKNFNGKQQSLNNLLGKNLSVIIFWATWGEDSIKMMSDLQKLYVKYQKKGLNVIGVCVQQQVISDTMRQRIIDTVKRKQITFPLLFDHQLQTFQLYHVIAVPTTFVIDKSRKILFKLAGYPIVGRDKLFNFIVEHFEGKPPVVERKNVGRKVNPNAVRYYNMARFEYKMGRNYSAKGHAIKAVKLDSLFVKPLLLAARIELREKQISNAAKYIERALKLKPNLTAALLLKGFLLAKQDSAKKAIKLLNNIIRNDSTSVLAFCYLGYAYGMNNNLKRSLLEFKHAETLSKNDYRIPLLRGEIYKRFGKLKKAKADKLKYQKLRVNAW